METFFVDVLYYFLKLCQWLYSQYRGMTLRMYHSITVANSIKDERKIIFKDEVDKITAPDFYVGWKANYFSSNKYLKVTF